MILNEDERKSLRRDVFLSILNRTAPQGTPLMYAQEICRVTNIILEEYERSLDEKPSEPKLSIVLPGGNHGGREN
jgi:hypothetical protein